MEPGGFDWCNLSECLRVISFLEMEHQWYGCPECSQVCLYLWLLVFRFEVDYHEPSFQCLDHLILEVPLSAGKDCLLIVTEDVFYRVVTRDDEPLEVERDGALLDFA